MLRFHLPTRDYRLLGALAGAWLGLASAALVLAQEHFPYVAYVVHNEIHVRSGPGQRYYPTQQLTQGFAVDVYRHDADGWCAIRPPEGSFSWVAAQDVRIVEENVAEVIAERVVTRVGSTLSPSRTSVQVLLERGERVAIVPGDTADPNWLRVVPPAGEFRWVAARDLGRQAPLEIAPPATTPSDWASTQSSESPPLMSTIPSKTTQPRAFDHLVQATSTTISPANSAAERVDVVAGSPAELQLAQFQGPSNSLAAPLLIATPASSGASSPPSIRLEGPLTPSPTITQGETPERLKEIELLLSQIVVEPPLQWQFDELKREASAMLSQTQEPELQARVRDYLDRIASFEQVRDGYRQLGQPAAAYTTTPITESPLIELAPPVDPMGEIVQNVRQRVREDLAEPPVESTGDSIDEPLYDAVGLLKPVVSRRDGAPRYALVDGKGEVVSFVTPTPDLNLQPYVGRRIGVNGSRGFMNEFRRAHVTAGRATTIDATVRR